MKLPLLAAVAVLTAAGASACSKAPDPAPAPAVAAASGAGSAEPSPSPSPSGGDDDKASKKDKPRKHGDKHQPMVDNPPPLSLDVTVAGVTTTWKQDSFDKVAKYKLGTDGDARDVWSLRDIATTLVGPGAHVVSVTGEDGTKPVDAVAWADTTKTPVLHTTRRGTLKFTWANDKGEWGDTAVKDVTKLEIAK